MSMLIDDIPIGIYVQFENMDGMSGEGIIIHSPRNNPEGGYYLINLKPDSPFGWVNNRDYPQPLSNKYWNIFSSCIQHPIKTILGNTIS